MYGIYANIWGILMVNVTTYSIHTDPMGIPLKHLECLLEISASDHAPLWTAIMEPTITDWNRWWQEQLLVSRNTRGIPRIKKKLSFHGLKNQVSWVLRDYSILEFTRRHVRNPVFTVFNVGKKMDASWPNQAQVKVYWLVVWIPLKNISQLGWWNSQYMGK